MITSNIQRIALSLTFTGLLTGCPPPTVVPVEDGPPKIPEVVTVPDERAQAQFAEVYAKYVAAKQDGSLSAAECESVTKDFDELYTSNRRSMQVARYNAGAVWEECGDIDKASKIYEELAAKNYHLALNQLGVIAWAKGDSKAALELFAKSVEADNTHAFAARNNLAAAHRDRYTDKANQADFEVAEKQIQNVLAVDTSNKAAYENLARLYYDRGRLEDPSYLVLSNLVVTQALRVLDKQGLRSADLWNLEGLLFMQDDNQVDALQAFKKAVEIEPKHPDANRNIGFIAIRFRDYTTAAKAFAVALEADALARDVDVHIAMGVAKRGLNEFAEAEQWYRRAIDLDKHDPRPWYNLAILNQDHLIGQANVEQAQIVEYYTVAKKHCTKFKAMAETNKSYAAAVKDCVDRVAIIDDTFVTFAKMADIEKELERLRKIEEQQELQRREELLRLEREAMAIGAPSPEELANQAAEAEALAEQTQPPQDPE